jgi:hypothetical protein
LARCCNIHFYETFINCFHHSGFHEAKENNEDIQMKPISKLLDDYNKIDFEFCQNFPDFVFSDYIELDDYLATSEPLPEEIEQEEAN